MHYPAVHRFSMYRGSGGNLANTEYVADNEITLPIYAGLRFEDIDYIATSLSELMT